MTNKIQVIIIAVAALSVFARATEPIREASKQESGNITLIIMPDSWPNSRTNVEYQITREHYNKLPEWDYDINGNAPEMPISLPSILNVARQDIIDRYNAAPEKIMLDRVEMHRIQNELKNIWYFIAMFSVNRSAKAFPAYPHDIITMRSVVLFDGTVIIPRVTELSQSVRFDLGNR